MEEIFRTIHATGSSLGCILNALLIYVVLTKSPKQIRSYGLIIVNFAITDLFICILNFLVMQRLISCGLSIVYISMGPCSIFSTETCFILYVLKLHFYTHSIWLLFISFAYRYYVLLRCEIAKSKIQLLIIFFYLPSIFQNINIFLPHGNEELAKQTLHKYHPEYDLSDKAVTINPSIFDFTVMYVIIHVVGLSIPMAISIIIMRKRIINKLTNVASGNKNSTSSKSYHLQIQLLRALTFQACIPIFYVFGGSCYIVQQFNLINNIFPQFIMYCLFLLVPILNPVSSFVFIAPYRRFLISLITKTRGKITNVYSLTYPSSSHGL